MIRHFCLLLCLLAPLARAASPTNTPALAGVAAFTSANLAWDAEQFAQAAAQFRTAITNEPGSVTNYYWLGVTEFHRMLQLRDESTNAVAADVAMDNAIAALEFALTLDAGNAECHALLGTIYGMKINGSLLRGIRFGPNVSRQRKLALATGKDNPRVQYLLGMCQFHTASKPAQWREALATLEVAETLFAAEEKNVAAPLAPRWGRDSCLAFIGRAHEYLGAPEKAAEFYAKALAIHPHHHVAEAGLKRVAPNEAK